MTRLLASLVGVALIIPASAAIAAPARDDMRPMVFDTPAPKDTPRRTPRPDRTAQPEATADPAPVVVGPPALPPARDSLVIGYGEPGALGQLPLLYADLVGYFRDAGFEAVTLVKAPDVERDLANGELDLGVLPMDRALAAYGDGTGPRAVAGFTNYAGDRGRYGGALVAAAPGLVEDEPSTVSAFLDAYIDALTDLAGPEGANDALELIEESALAVPAGVAGRWAKELEAFAPFDGGFGDPAVDGGLGELADFLGVDGGDPANLGEFIATETLALAQTRAGLDTNPVESWLDAPVASISVGLPPSLENSPIESAVELGYFTDAGFEDVDIVEVEQPLLGLMTGELDFGVVDLVDAAEGVSQGLPAVAIAGHRNYRDDGTYGGDAVLTSLDLLGEHPATATALLVALVRASQDRTDDPSATAYLPLDGGYGSRADAGGTGEMARYLTTEGQDTDLERLIDPTALTLAQSWWGLPHNPIDPGLGELLGNEDGS